MIELSKLERVDLRGVWPHEAQDFTPWLASNIDSLADVLGLDLDVLTEEADVGPFSLDILAHDLGSDRQVVIENQLEGTDHDHLGKMLTYAAGYDAHVVVWIAKEFRPEHRAAIDWLNHRTDTDTAFFAVEIEAWKIGDSHPAPRFNLVAFPNDWQKEIARNADGGGGGLTDRQRRYRDFFQELIDVARDQHRLTNARKGQPQNWYHFPSGYAGVPYSASFIRGREASIELYFDRGDKHRNRLLFDDLIQRREQIEVNLGYGLVWDPIEHAQACRIGVRREGTIDDGPEVLREIQEWMIDRLLSMHTVFQPHLDEILS